MVCGIAFPAGVAFAGLTSDAVATTTGDLRYIPGSVGGLAAMALPLVLSAATSRGHRVPKAALFVVSLAALALASHRSAWIAAAIAVVVVAMVAGRQRQRFVAQTGAAALVLIVAGLALTLATDRATVAEDQLARLETLTNPAADPNGRDRLERWYVALNQAKEHAFIGEGFGVTFISPVSDIESEPHNFAVTVLARAGLVSAMLFLAMIAIAMARVAKAASSDEQGWLAAGLAGALTAGVVVAGFNVLLESPYFAPVFWFAAGIALQLAYAARSRGATDASGAASLPNPGA